MAEKLITVSLSPAVNAILWLDTLSSEQENQVKKERIEPSGGALNISRVLSALQTDSLAMGAYGEDSGVQFIRLLEKYGIRHDFLPCKGEVRQDITMILPKNTVIKTARTGFKTGIAQLYQIREKISKQVNADEQCTVIFSDERMQGMEGSELIQFIRHCCNDSTKLVLNLAGLTLDDLKSLHPYLTMIKLSELKAITKVNFRNETTMLRCMQSMTGDLEHFVVDLGAKGFLYAGREACYRIIIPQNKAAHPERADYFLSGFLAGIRNELPLHDVLELAGGCAAWLTLGEQDAFSIEAAERGKKKILLEKML